MKWIELPKSDKKLWKMDAALVGVGLAVVMVLILVAQLFHFEKLPAVFDGYGLAGVAVAAIIVAMELFALPFLMSLKISPLMRGVSALFAVLTPLWWWCWGVYLTYHEGYLTGILGTSVDIPVSIGYIWLTTLWLVVSLLLIVVVFVPKTELSSTAETLPVHAAKKRSVTKKRSA